MMISNKYSTKPVYVNNPFSKEAVSSFKSDWIDYREKGVRMIVEETGEVMDFKKPESSVQVFEDTARFVKFYAGFGEQFRKLKESGQSIFWFIFLKRLKRNRDFVYIDMAECVAYCGWKSKTGFYTGLCDLIEHDFIAKKAQEENCFFINITLFFNGSRKHLQVFRDWVTAEKAKVPPEVNKLQDKNTGGQLESEKGGE
jgi:hypothetical protein